MSPIYRNCNKVRKEINGKVIEPTTQIISPVFYNENEIELVKISDEPSFNPTLYSAKIDKNTIIEIPKFDTFTEWVSKFNIHFYVEKGEVEIYYNNKNNKPPLKLYNQCKWNVRCLTRTIDKLHILSERDFVLWIEIERI